MSERTLSSPSALKYATGSYFNIRHQDGLCPLKRCSLTLISKLYESTLRSVYTRETPNLDIYFTLRSHVDTSLNRQYKRVKKFHSSFVSSSKSLPFFNHIQKHNLIMMCIMECDILNECAHC